MEPLFGDNGVAGTESAGTSSGKPYYSFLAGQRLELSTACVFGSCRRGFLDNPGRSSGGWGPGIQGDKPGCGRETLLPVEALSFCEGGSPRWPRFACVVFRELS